eukprot:TRINITY_DN5059_c0_g1_i1.p1 TRINITY_DN5059_c0_g1~~TRINITY_DN5059_c0_g1_i1.p1  ORF type:complete len:1513 (-),score=421.00 TRINITY_DN5059_c0_g1_i1:122-4660(-)
MPPKDKGKAAPAAGGASSLPVPEDELAWPEGVEPIPDADFRWATAHLIGHTFVFEGEQPEDGSLPPLQEFDACSQVVAKLQADQSAEDPLGKPYVALLRSDLEAMSEGGSLAQAFKKKAEAEIAARHRRKNNQVRKAHLMDVGAIERDASKGTVPPNSAPSSARAGGDLDMIFVLVGYPETAEEIAELQDAGGFDISDAWTSLYLAGHTIEEVPQTPEGGDEAVENAEELPPKRVKKACKAPEAVACLFDAIHNAKLGTGLANSTMKTEMNCHSFAGRAEAAPDHIVHVIRAVSEEVAAERIKFKAWLEEQEFLAPSSQSGGEASPEAPSPLELRRYCQLVEEVKPAQHDVAFLLHCMCEQVAMSLKPDLPDLRDNKPEVLEEQNDINLHAIDSFLDEAFENIVMEGERKQTTAVADVVQGEGAEDGADMVLPLLDYAACRHYGHKLPGNVFALDEVHRILGHLQAPGVCRNSFPEEPAPGKASQNAACNRLYNYMPQTTIVEIERHLLLHEFEKLLDGAHPERKWNLSERLVHERIPSTLLIQTLANIAQPEGFLETKYLKRLDCLLVAVHHRALAGRLLWHSWVAPTGSSGAAGQGAANVFPVPTFNDWCYFSKQPVDPSAGEKKMLDIDGRDLGYCKALEKLFVPSDGSVILLSRLQRGIGEGFPRPDGGPDPKVEEEEALDEDSEPETGADGDDEPKPYKRALPPGFDDFIPPPKHELRSARIVKDGLTFGISTDTDWEGVATTFRQAREEEERAVAEAQAAADAERAEKEAARAAQGLPPEEDEPAAVVAEEESRRGSMDTEEGEGMSIRRLEDLQFGRLWVSFPDGARCCARMHRERQWWDAGEKSYDVTNSRPGTVVTYSSVTGAVVLAYSNGVVSQSLPPALWNLPPVEKAVWPIACCGGALDVEVARLVTPFGVLSRELLSGRKELYYASGLRAARNPTKEELMQQVESEAQAGVQLGSGASRLEASRRLAASIKEWPAEPFASKIRTALLGPPRGRTRDELLDLMEKAKPSLREKAAGLPGHWIVSHPDGRVVGRVSATSLHVEPLPPEPKEPPAEGAAEEEIDEADLLEEDDEVMTSGSLLETMLKGTLVEDGAIVEYDIEPLSLVSNLDPHTGQQSTQTIDGLFVITEPDGTTRTCILPDGTQMKSQLHSEGKEIVVEKERMARITCTINDGAPITKSTSLDVECADGTIIRVVPQCLSFTGEFLPADPTRGEPDTVSTNASVAVQHHLGTSVTSWGGGEVDVVSTFASGGDMGATMNREQVYTAHLDEDKISLKDREGNSFDVMGDQTVACKLAVSMGDDFPSPRCVVPGVPYKHPDADFLPVPENAPDPRLFVIYGDGEAEELLLSRDVGELTRLAELDEKTVVLEEQMGRPMEVCKCITFLRDSTSEMPSLPPMQEGVDVPTIVAGFQSPSASAVLPPQGPREYTRFRQFIEYPAIDDEQRSAFQQALACFEKDEAEHQRLHLDYGSGFGSGGPAPNASRANSRLSLPPAGLQLGGA